MSQFDMLNIISLFFFVLFTIDKFSIVPFLGLTSYPSSQWCLLLLLLLLLNFLFFLFI